MLGPAAFWLLDPIVHLAGVPFLLFYSTLVTAALVAIWVLLERTRRSDLPNLRIPDQLDPYKIAYLRGGDSEVIRTAMVELVEQGWIVQDPTQKVSATKPIQWKTDMQGKSTESFEPLQRILLENFQVARTGDTVFQSSVQKKVQAITETFRKWVAEEELWTVRDKDKNPMVPRAIWSSFLLVEGLGVYKLLHAMSEHRSNVGFLAFGLLITPALFFIVTRRKRLSNRGERFLQDIQTAYKSLRSLKFAKPAMRTNPSESSQDRIEYPASSFPMPLLAMGIFGISALQGTTLDPLYTASLR
jgi:uncharacterized protein (TIGR04222 family)